MARKLPYSKDEYFKFLEETLKPQPLPTNFLGAFQKRLLEKQQGKLPKIAKL